MCELSELPPKEVKPENDWTLMFFFAGDSHLSPSMISQLKAIKDAGFQKNTTVLIHFDPNEAGAGTRTFEVNRKRKRERGTVIGDGLNPFVRNLKEDVVDGVPTKANASEALQQFLDFGLRHYTAKHYMLFLVGHGMIVGNDAFLPDSRPNTAITLERLGRILADFSGGVALRDGTFELVGLHSCSMSAVEVVYQLKGTARYLMATEGVSFVSSWPYRQLMKKIFKTIDEAKQDHADVDVDRLVSELQRLSLHNSIDFMFSGLSADLCLCSLEPKQVEELTAPLQNLTKALKKGLRNLQSRELILMAHLRAQSYWQETYTDIYDFCCCLERQCRHDNDIQEEMLKACEAVRSKLEESNKRKRLIVQSDHFGPLYQYSHGLSVYFPWSRPIEDDFQENTSKSILGRYENYEFTKALGQESWLSFLKAYFVETCRNPREGEDQGAVAGEPRKAGITSTVPSPNGGGIPAIKAASNISSEALVPDKVSPALQKPAPPLGGGAGCTCQTVKNFPMYFSRSPRASLDPNEETVSCRQPAPAFR